MGCGRAAASAAAFSVMPGRVMIRLLIVAILLALAASPASSETSRASDTTPSPEQTLVDRYAPIVMIKKQPAECSPAGEQFRPVAVDILFGADDVRLMRNEGGRAVEVKRGIDASDLYQLGKEYYLDLPFDPRDPGCHYETWNRERMSELGLQPSLYAKISTEPGKDGIVIQYWYNWVNNLFNDVHESDWEGIQLNFDATSVEEILEKNLLPSTIAFAQHAGGERALWTDAKLSTQGTHVVSHPSSGSHADYYGSAIWLGWGEHGSGFGCDRSEAPEEELPASIILLPDEVTSPTSEFAWLTFEGNWGQLEVPALFSGPQGPNMHPRWTHPISWSEGIRTTSLAVPEHPTIGPGISQVFCGAAEFGSKLVILFGVDARDLSLLIIGFGIALLLFSALVGAFRSRRCAVCPAWVLLHHARCAGGAVGCRDPSGRRVGSRVHDNPYHSPPTRFTIPERLLRFRVAYGSQRPPGTADDHAPWTVRHLWGLSHQPAAPARCDRHVDTERCAADARTPVAGAGGAADAGDAADDRALPLRSL